MPHEGLHWIDYLMILLYLGAIVYISVVLSRKQKSTEAYFTADRSIPAWALAMSLMATIVSTVTFLAYPGNGYSGNWILLVQGLMVPIVLLAIVWFIVPMYRQVIRLSAYEYFEKRFGYLARLYSSLAFLMAHFTKMGSALYLLALPLTSMIGLDQPYAVYAVIVGLGITAVLYTLLGGIEAVIWTDCLQGSVLLGGGLISAGMLLFGSGQGPVAVVQTAWENHKISMGPYDLDLTRLTFWVMAINGIFYALQKYGTDQTVVQRFLLAKSNRAAIRASVMGVGLCVGVWVLFMFIGTLLWVYYRMPGHELPPGVAGDRVFPHFIMTQLPIGIKGLILTALIAAGMSIMDSDMNSLAAVGVEDYYRRIRRHATDKQCLRMGRILVVITGLGATGIACLYVRLGGEAILGTVFALYAIFSGGIAGLFALGFFTVRANRRGLNVGIAACVLFTAYALLTSTKFDLGGPEKVQLLDLGRFNFSHHKYMLGVYSHMVLFVVGYAASFLFPSDKDTRGLTLYGWLSGQSRERGDITVQGKEVGRA
ncbi:MAG: sodium:solute symporter [Planctomycetes bacterium]|jgi:SSS family solute:Na+ symporter|nr:sodium:solute symporter [Planctomycetota bacterium]